MIRRVNQIKVIAKIVDKGNDKKKRNNWENIIQLKQENMSSPVADSIIKMVKINNHSFNPAV